MKETKLIDGFCRSFIHGKSSLLSLCLLVSVVISLSCGSKATDPRTVIPADSLVYLETSDLGKVLDAVTSNPKFQRLAKTKPDTSALNGIRLSVAVTGLHASREPVSKEHVVGHFRPRFVAVAETNAWNYQALSFAENKLGEFVNDIYGGEVELATTDKLNGKYFTWTARDGRKAYALVRGSLILFGNDETAIDSCVNVMDGQAESIAGNSKVSEFAGDSLASGYISRDGVAQIANIAGVSLAAAAGEEADVQSFIARVVPEIVRNSVTEVTWASKQLEHERVEDSYTISIDRETAKVLGETILPGSDQDPDLSRFIPIEFVSTTRYNLKDARIAWRSALLTARTKTDQVSGGLLSAFSSSLLEPYGVEDAETFVSAVGSALQTVRFDAEGDDVAVIARIVNLETLKRAVAKELILSKPPEKFQNADLWRSADGELAAAIVENRIIVGEAKSVERCLTARDQGRNLATVAADSRFGNSSAPIVTYGSESDAGTALVAAVSERKSQTDLLIQTYMTETRFNQNGLERRTVSDFGLIGTIIGQLDSNN